MLVSDDVVFAWAIGKALLIVIASLGSLVYVAWAVTYHKEDNTHIGTPKQSALKYMSSIKAAGAQALQTEQLKAGETEQHAGAA